MATLAVSSSSTPGVGLARESFALSSKQRQHLPLEPTIITNPSHTP